MLTSQKMIANAQQAAGRRTMATPANARRSTVRCEALPKPEDAGKAAAALAASMLLLAPTPAIAAPNQAAEVADLTSAVKGLVNKGKSASNKIQDRAPDVVDVPASDVPAQAQRAIDIPPVADILKPLAAEPAPAPKGKKELTLLEEDERSREGGDGSGLDLNVPSPPKPLATSMAATSAEPVATVALTDPAARVRRGDAGTSGETTVNKGSVQSLGSGFKSSLKDEVNQVKDIGSKATDAASSLADKVTSKTSSSMAAPQPVATVALTDPAERVRRGDAGTSGETTVNKGSVQNLGSSFKSSLKDEVNQAKDLLGADKAADAVQDLADKVTSKTSSSMAAPQPMATVALTDPAEKVRRGDAGTSGETSSDGLNLPSPGDAKNAIEGAASKAADKAQDLADKVKSAGKGIDVKPISDAKGASKAQARELVGNAKVAERRTKNAAKDVAGKARDAADRLDDVTDEAGARVTQGAKDAKDKVEGFLRKRYI